MLQAADDPAVGETKVDSFAACGPPSRRRRALLMRQREVVALVFISTKRVAFHSLLQKLR